MMNLGSILLACILSCFGDSIKVDDSPIARDDSVAKSVVINDVVIEGSKVTHYPDKDVWTITKEMRKNTFDTYSLLKKIPGFHYDTFRERLSYWGRENILVTVDGKVKEEGYGGHLANMRFRKIEIYDHPDGRFDGYDAVVNLVTYENWQGYDARGLNHGTVLPSTDYGNTLAKLRNDYTYTYTRPKYDISANLKYDHSDDRYNQSMTITGNDIAYHSVDGNSYTNQQKSTSLSMYADVDYKISKNHTISGKYSFSDVSDNTESDNTIVKDDILLGESFETKRLATDKTDVKSHTISAFYQGSAGNWKLNSELTYDNYSERSWYNYSEPSIYETANVLRNNRESWFLNADAVLNMSRKGSLNIGYQYYNKHYTSEKEYLEETYTSSLVHNKGYLTYTHSLHKRLSLRVGGSAEYLGTRNATFKDHQMMWGGNAMMRYIGMGAIFIGMLTYKTSTKYPTLYQTLPITNQADPLLSLSGNTRLKASTSHAFALSLRYGRIGLNSAVSFSGNEILPTYTLSGTDVLRTYSNLRRVTHSSVLSYTPKTYKVFGNDLQLRASLTYAGSYVNFPSERKYVDYWGGQATVDYSLRSIADVQIQYTKMTTTMLSPQTVSQRANDSWELVISKDLLKRHVQLQ